MELILEETRELMDALMDFIKTPTPIKQNPIPTEIQLALACYRLVHACSLSSLQDVFGRSISTSDQAFDHSQKKRKKSLETRAVLPEIFILC